MKQKKPNEPDDPQREVCTSVGGGEKKKLPWFMISSPDRELNSVFSISNTATRIYIFEPARIYCLFWIEILTHIMQQRSLENVWIHINGIGQIDPYNAEST